MLKKKNYLNRLQSKNTENNLQESMIIQIHSGTLLINFT